MELFTQAAQEVFLFKLWVAEKLMFGEQGLGITPAQGVVFNVHILQIQKLAELGKILRQPFSLQIPMAHTAFILRLGYEPQTGNFYQWCFFAH